VRDVDEKALVAGRRAAVIPALDAHVGEPGRDEVTTSSGPLSLPTGIRLTIGTAAKRYRGDELWAVVMSERL
jgi:hypothetical protein